ncbi:MAG: hypothetical protein MK060_01165 [Blastomonas sp.]|uniref:hypothetical protein n=1 Tax=Blastomonas sp. TaxID=1909299 RepID=UPI0010F55FF5|nr:hypothetical protein [Blastomonas sp.]
MALVAASIAHAQEAEVFELKGESATVLDDDDMPVFRADRAFLIGLLGTKGETFAVSQGRVHISRDGEEGVGLRCADLKPLKVCGEQATVVSRSRQLDETRGGGAAPAARTAQRSVQNNTDLVTTDSSQATCVQLTFKPPCNGRAEINPY